jgi:formylglycine-generating enzyme required for sulfatase activity
MTQEEIAHLQEKIAHLEGLRDVLGDETVNKKIGELQALISTSGGAIINGYMKTDGGDLVGRDKQTTAENHSVSIGGDATNVTIVISEDGTKTIEGDAPVDTSAVDRNSALKNYLKHIIARNRYLQLQGIRSGGRLVSIELEQIYITLRATQERTIQAEESWLKEEGHFAPGEMHKMRAEQRISTETVSVSVDRALADHRHLAVLGDPGSGKTTMLRYLALLYARDLASGGVVVADKLKLNESGYLPILLPLRQIGSFLREHPSRENDTFGHKLLLEFLFTSLGNERIKLPADFFDSYLNSGKAIILLDGLDEVADEDLRRQVSRLVEAFTDAYPSCRSVVTSRIKSYTGAARLGGDYATTTVRDFMLADVENFLSTWHRLIAVGQMGTGQSALDFAADQTAQLMAAIRENVRIRELAINPLMLTVIALVHRDRVKLPDRRAELYAEAVDVLLGKRDEARGIKSLPILGKQPFDTGDKRLLLQSIALAIHESERKDIDAEDLRRLLAEHFAEMLPEKRGVRKAVERFLQNIAERAGILIARAEGVYAFSHLTFQEYLAASAIAARDDYLSYTLERSADAWWREVILLEAGYLSMQSKERTTNLIKAIIEKQEEPEPYHNLVLGAESLRDVGENRVSGNLGSSLRTQLQAELETPVPDGWIGKMRTRLTRGMTAEQLTARRVSAANALARVGGNQYWRSPYGEPEWVDIPAGEFWMGEANNAQKIHLGAFKISRVPVTNAQYALFIEATEHEAPRHFEDGHAPKGLESHPVIYVSWHDALAYCKWMSEVSGKNITLPSEAEWEKAARGPSTGSGSKRAYPWGDDFEMTRCNTRELGLQTTTPVGIFQEGASPYGVLDLSGNVDEWTNSWYSGEQKYRVLRGGSWYNRVRYARCAYRNNNNPDNRTNNIGFRIVVSLAFR